MIARKFYSVEHKVESIQTHCKVNESEWEKWCQVFNKLYLSANVSKVQAHRIYQHICKTIFKLFERILHGKINFLPFEYCKHHKADTHKKKLATNFVLAIKCTFYVLIIFSLISPIYFPFHILLLNLNPTLTKS